MTGCPLKTEEPLARSWSVQLLLAFLDLLESSETLGYRGAVCMLPAFPGAGG